jgi:LacI family transcriptional regulator
LAFLVLPRLTTIRQPIQEVTEIAVRIVPERQQIGSVALKPALVERGSAAPPPLS